MSPRGRWAFLALIVAQAAHSADEYLFRLFDLFPPARFVNGLVSEDLAVAFRLVNAALVLFALWFLLCGRRLTSWDRRSLESVRHATPTFSSPDREPWSGIA